MSKASHTGRATPGLGVLGFRLPASAEPEARALLPAGGAVACSTLDRTSSANFPA